jgi:hypothetical protein
LIPVALSGPAGGDARLHGVAGDGAAAAGINFWLNFESALQSGLRHLHLHRLPRGQPSAPNCVPTPRDADAEARMARKLRSKKGSRMYAQRNAIVEPVNGQITEVRGLRRFPLRSLRKVDGE